MDQQTARSREGQRRHSLQPPRDINQQNINTWKHHEEDGHIMEVDVKKGKASGLEEEAEARKAEAARKASESTEVAMKSAMNSRR